MATNFVRHRKERHKELDRQLHHTATILKGAELKWGEKSAAEYGTFANNLPVKKARIKVINPVSRHNHLRLRLEKDRLGKL